MLVKVRTEVKKEKTAYINKEEIIKEFGLPWDCLMQFVIDDNGDNVIEVTWSEVSTDEDMHHN